MPVLERVQARELLKRAFERPHPFTLDYCRTCDEFYWLDLDAERELHNGHRKTIVPFVEEL
jgi:hypothetical protein